MLPIARRAAALMFLAALLAGCATRVPLDREAAGRVGRIGLVTPAMPEGPTSFIRNAPGMQFGMIGAIADGLLQLERERQLAAVLAAQGFDASARWQAILGETLARDGFTVVAVPGARRGGRFLESYPPAEADALLDVVVMAYGYHATSIVSSFRPTVRMRTRLATPQGRTLMEEEYEVGPDAPLRLGELTFVAIGPRHAFDTSREKLADGARVIAGIEEAMREAAARIAEALRPAAANAPGLRLSAR